MKSFKRLDSLITDILLVFVIMIGGGILGSLLMAGVQGLFLAMAPSVVESGIWQCTMEYLSFIGIWILFFLFTRFSKKDLRISSCVFDGLKGNTFKMLLYGLLAGLGMNLLCALAAILNGDIHLRFSSFRPMTLLWIFFCVFIQSASEEVLCRCFLYQRIMRRRNNVYPAALVSASLFAALHLSNPGITTLALFNIFLYGLLFTAIVYYTDSLWAAFGVHTAWNFCQNIILGLPNSGLVSPFSIFALDASTARNSFFYNVGFGVEGCAMAALMMAGATALIVYQGRKNNIKPTDLWADNPEKEGS